MKKLKLFIITLFVGISMCINAQETQIIYTYSMASNSDPSSTMFKVMEKLTMDKSQIDITLYVNGDKTVSIYHDANRLADNAEYSMAQITADNRNYICNNISDSTSQYNKVYDSTFYVVAEQYDISDWELLNEIDTINGELCKKAIKRRLSFFDNRIIGTVWYSVNNKAPIGPLDYVGFPGQVIKVVTNLYSIYLTSTEENIDSDIICALEGEPITYKALSKMKSEKMRTKFGRK